MLDLRRFLNIAEYMLVEDAQNIPGVTLMDAIALLSPVEDGETQAGVVPTIDPDAGVDMLNQSLMGARKR